MAMSIIIYDLSYSKCITNSNILNFCQYGFREGFFTSYALVELTLSPLHYESKQPVLSSQ